MKIINPSYEFVTQPDSEQILNIIERAYRICYLSEQNNRDNFIRAKIKIRHESPLEHCIISVIVTTNRAISHELVRHRIASYCESSTRYCNYSKEKFDGQLTFIRPAWVSEDVLGEHNTTPALDIPAGDLYWFNNCLDCEGYYLDCIEAGYKPEQAREVLNNSVSTKIMITMNIRQWRHFFELRALGTTGRPHPNMTQWTIPMLEDFKKAVPIVFDDLEVV